MRELSGITCISKLAAAIKSGFGLAIGIPFDDGCIVKYLFDGLEVDALQWVCEGDLLIDCDCTCDTDLKPALKPR